jgi:predicted nucleic acid-binding Zn ribbon protein
MKRGPQHVSNVLAQLMARRGFARQQGAAACQEAWGRAAGPLAAEHTRAGAVRRGTLEVMVAHSTLLQELSFQKIELLQRLQELLPDEGIRDIRFRVGTIM